MTTGRNLAYRENEAVNGEPVAFNDARRVRREGWGCALKAIGMNASRRLELRRVHKTRQNLPHDSGTNRAGSGQ
jgi:hypothetical protein